MALAVKEEVRQKLHDARRSVQAASEHAGGGIERVKLVFLLLAVGVALFVASRLAEDPVHRRLSDAPIDDEPVTAEEQTEVAEARKEGSIPWEEAKQELTRTDRQLA